MKRRVVVTGTGAITPNGLNSDEFWTNMKNGVSGIGLLEQLDRTKFPAKVSAEVRGFDPVQYMDAKQVRKTDPFLQYAVAASQMAINDSGIDIASLDPFRFGVIVGTGIGGLRVTEKNCFKYVDRGVSRISPFMIPMLIVNMAAGYVAIQFKLKGPNYCISTACASGTHSIGDAFRLIQYGDARIVQ